MTQSADNGGSIEIPTGALTACPLEKFAFVRVGAVCIACPHFDGLSDRFPGSQQAFQTRYLVRCRAEPVQRSVSMLAGGE